MTQYSSNKIFHHRDRIDELKSGELTNPLQVYLVISDLCNQDCNFCAYRMSGYTTNQLFGVRVNNTVNNNPNRRIPYEKCLEILDDCQQMGVKAIQITGGGEPSVHPFHDKIYQAVLDRGMDLALISNGVILRDEAIPPLLNATWVRFSIDSSNPESYAKVRKSTVEHYGRVWGNVRKLVSYKKDRGSKVTIGLGFVVTSDNWMEVEEFVILAKESGVDNVRISAVFQPSNIGYFSKFFNEAYELCRLAKDKHEDGKFIVFNNFGYRCDDLIRENPDYSFCGYQHLTTYIGGDMNVYRCCVTAYSNHGLLGSISDRRFSEFWNSEERISKLTNFDARSCERCMFNEKNKTILYAIDKHPEHVNYI